MAFEHADLLPGIRRSRMRGLLVVVYCSVALAADIAKTSIDSRLMDACMAGEAAEVKTLLAEGTELQAFRRNVALCARSARCRSITHEGVTRVNFVPRRRAADDRVRGVQERTRGSQAKWARRRSIWQVSFCLLQHGIRALSQRRALRAWVPQASSVSLRSSRC